MCQIMLLSTRNSLRVVDIVIPDRSNIRAASVPAAACPICWHSAEISLSRPWRKVQGGKTLLETRRSPPISHQRGVLKNQQSSEEMKPRVPIKPYSRPYTHSSYPNRTS
jgi:hypothetical protein